MSIKQFLSFLVGWFLLCALLIEPTWIAPYFDGLSGLEIAFNGNLASLHPNPQETSMDHFRVLCLLYIALPCMVYLASQMSSVEDQS